MPTPRLLLIASWIVTTMVATIISAAGVSIVTRDVTDNHEAALGRADVIALLAAPRPEGPASSAVPTPPPTPAPTTTEAPVTTEAAVSSDPPAPPSSAAPTTAAPPPTAPPTTVPPLGDAVAATYSSSGGSMTVACLGDAIALVSARPNDGYRMVVDDDGPEWVFVRFDQGGDGHDGLAAWCRDDAPTDRDDRRGRDRAGDDGHRGRDDGDWGHGWDDDGWGGGR